MNKINEQQYIGLLNEIVTFNHDYKIEFANKKNNASSYYCDSICQYLCQRLLNEVAPYFSNGKDKAKQQLKQSVGIIIGNFSYVRKEVFVDLSRAQTDDVINAIDDVVKENTRKTSKQKEHFIGMLNNLILELKEEFGLEAS